MAKKRMFSLDIIDTDVFIEMPPTSRLLYYELCMRADDDGFVGSPKKIQRIVGCSDDDLKILITKKFIIPFNTGVIVIRHWKLNNFLRKDRHTETIYKEEFKQLTEDENGSYKLNTEFGQLNVNQMPTDGQPSIDKSSIEENSIEEYNIPASEDKSSTASAKANDITALKDKELQNEKEESKKKEAVKHKYGEYKNVLLKDSEIDKLKHDYPNWSDLIKYLDEYIEMKGYKAKSHYLCIKKWVVDAVKRQNMNKSTAQEEFLNE